MINADTMISVTELASEKLKEILVEEGAADASLRVILMPGPHGGAQYMLTLIEGDLDYIDNHSGQHTRGNVTHHHGENDHIGYLRRPFLQAQESIHSRARAADVDL